MPGVSVIVPARDAAATLGETLDGLRLQTGVEPFDVIVVDNGSLDDTAGVAARAGAIVVRRERGDGPGPARNAGARLAAGAVLAFTDADCVPQPGWLAAGLAALGSSDLVQGSVVADPSAKLGPFDRTVVVDHLTGLFEAASLFVRRDAFDLAGGFPAGLESPGDAPFGEDALFGWAARRAGSSVTFSAAAVVAHAVTRRGVAGFITERTRAGFFPSLIRRVPELREELCFGAIFLTKRTAAFDLAVAGLVISRVRRRPWPVAMALPYAALTAREAAAWGRRLGIRVAVGTVLADGVGACALTIGSLRSRTLVL